MSSYLWISPKLCKILLGKTLSERIKKFLRKSYAKEYLKVYDLPKIIHTSKPKGLAFIYFMGIGDALFTLPVLEECKRRWPDLPIFAYVSSTMDAVNSPHVGDILRMVPFVDAVIPYRGRIQGDLWLNYDYSDANIEEEFMILPLVWRDSSIYRTLQLFDLFCLGKYDDNTPVTIYPQRYQTEKAISLVKKLKLLYAEDVVLLHLDTRSSNYIYPYINSLVQALTDDSKTVVCFTPISSKNENIILIDTSIFKLEDVISFLYIIVESNKFNISAICVQSMFWVLLPIFGIRILGLNIFYDPFIAGYCHNSIKILTSFRYSKYSRLNCHIVQATEYAISYSIIDKNIEFINYFPETIIKHLANEVCNVPLQN